MLLLFIILNLYYYYFVHRTFWNILVTFFKCHYLFQIERSDNVNICITKKKMFLKHLGVMNVHEWKT